jgi:hypothetical protein
MLTLGIRATLNEVLEVRDGPLSENEAWAVISSSLLALQNLFKYGECLL